jgi:hypothetical protein
MRTFTRKKLALLGIFFVLSGCIDKQVDILYATMPRVAPSDAQKNSRDWIVDVYPSRSSSYLLNYGPEGFGTNTSLFRSDCDSYRNRELIGNLVYNENSNHRSFEFAIFSGYIHSDIYDGLRRGDCVFIESSRYFFDTTYRSNIVGVR